MLRITLRQDGTQICLALAGRLCGPWVGETENVWRSVPGSGNEIAVDMREVTGVDGAGRGLLAAMHSAGVRLIGAGVWMTSLIEEISGQHIPDHTMRKRRARKFAEDNRVRRGKANGK